MATTLQKHTITAFYESRDYADAAANKLRASGVPASDIDVSPENAKDEYGLYGDDTTTGASPKKAGFWASLEDLFGGTDDHHTYAEGVRRGHVLLTAHVTDAQLDKSVGIVEEHGSIDLDEHEDTWRSEGWTGGPAGGVLAATGVAGAGATGLAMTGAAPVTKVVTTEVVTPRAPVASVPVARAPVPATPKPVRALEGGEQVLQVVEERLSVGKRAVSRGKVRLHSYVVQRDVSEDVSLHRESVSIDRHAVDRPVAGLAADAFAERTLELEEIDEEAVVGKTAYVVEEVGIRKDVTDRVETVRDTLRSTKVDVEDGRTVSDLARGPAEGSDTGRVSAGMDVIASDGTRMGTVDRLEGTDRIKLAEGSSPDGKHHTVPMAWVDHVDRHVHLNRTPAEVKAGW